MRRAVEPSLRAHGDVAGPVAQLAAVLWLRQRMQRRARWAQPALLTATPSVLALALVAGSTGAANLPAGRAGEVGELLPIAYLTFLVGALVAAVASSGGREIVPRAQLVAFPCSPVTDHLGTLLLAPLNLAWLLQALALAFLTGVVTPWEPGLALTAAVMVLWMAACTAAAQVAAWSVELVRTLPGGVWVLRGLLAATAVVAARSANADTLVAVLDRTPTVRVTDAAIGSASGAAGTGVLGAAALALVTAVAVVGGGWLRTALERRPGREQARRDTTAHVPRELPPLAGFGSDVLVWRRVDRASVLRSPPLRRGLLVLLLIPSAGALLSRVAWTDLPLLTSVVAAAAGMLFGVNVVSLDGPGATWRQTLPVAPRVWLTARAIVLAEIVLLTGVVVTLTAALAADGRPSATTLAALVLTPVAVTAQVVARCLRWSISRPHRADLRTTRDSPAPPGAMTAYSAQLVLAAALVGVVMTLAARAPSPVWPALVITPSLLLSALSIHRSFRRWDDPVERARVVAVVSAG